MNNIKSIRKDENKKKVKGKEVFYETKEHSEISEQEMDWYRNCLMKSGDKEGK